MKRVGRGGGWSARDCFGRRGREEATGIILSLMLAVKMSVYHYTDLLFVRPDYLYSFGMSDPHYFYFDEDYKYCTPVAEMLSDPQCVRPIIYNELSKNIRINIFA